MEVTSKPTIWRDDPPSEATEWWVRRRFDGSILRLTLLPDGYWITSPYMVKSGRVAEQFQFGPRVLGAQETLDLLAKVERLERENGQLRAQAAELAEIHRVWRLKGVSS